MLSRFGDALVVQDRRARLHGRSGSNTGGQDLVLDLEQPAGRLRGALGLGDHGGDALADEADDVVEHVGVVGIDEMVLVGGRAVEPPRDVLPGEDRDHARDRQRLVAADGDDARMGVRRAQHLEVQHVRPSR